jgi:hypothetical protein
VEALQAMNQHGAVRLIQDVGPNLDDVIRRDADDVSAERGMMECAKCNTVWHRRQPERIGIRNDMRGFEELVAPQAADRAMVLVSSNNTLAKLPLMQTLAEHTRYVASPYLSLFGILRHRSQACESTLLDTYGERQLGRIIANDEDWPLRHIQARNDTVKIDKWHLPLHREP